MVAPGGAGGSAQATVAATRGGERFARWARQVAAIRTPGWLILTTGTVVLGEGHRLSGRRGPDVHGPCTIRPAGQVGGVYASLVPLSRTLTGRSSFGLVLGAEYGPNVPTGCDERPGRPGLLAYPRPRSPTPLTRRGERRWELGRRSGTGRLSAYSVVGEEGRRPVGPTGSSDGAGRRWNRPTSHRSARSRRATPRAGVPIFGGGATSVGSGVASGGRVDPPAARVVAPRQPPASPPRD